MNFVNLHFSINGLGKSQNTWHWTHPVTKANRSQKERGEYLELFLLFISWRNKSNKVFLRVFFLAESSFLQHFLRTHDSQAVYKSFCQLSFEIPWLKVRGQSLCSSWEIMSREAYETAHRECTDLTREGVNQMEENGENNSVGQGRLNSCWEW